METEIWKDIKDYEGLYKISNYGNIKTFNNKQGITNRKNDISKYGYLRVNLSNNRTVKHHSIHRLVAQAFIPNLENKPCINHKDGNKQNNTLENLEWCTYKENIRHSRDNGLSNVSKNNIFFTNHPTKGKIGKLHYLSKKINQYDLQGNFIKTWDCINDVERNLGILHTNIGNSLNNRSKTAGGFIWKYYKS